MMMKMMTLMMVMVMAMQKVLAQMMLKDGKMMMMTWSWIPRCLLLILTSAREMTAHKRRSWTLQR
jgi:hypothetical protein